MYQHSVLALSFVSFNFFFLSPPLRLLCVLFSIRALALAAWSSFCAGGARCGVEKSKGLSRAVPQSQGPNPDCCWMESNSDLHLQGIYCLLQENTEAVGVLLCRHLQVPWVFPPAMTQTGSEDVSAWSRLRGILVSTVTFLVLPEIE